MLSLLRVDARRTTAIITTSSFNNSIRFLADLNAPALPLRVPGRWWVDDEFLHFRYARITFRSRLFRESHKVFVGLVVCRKSLPDGRKTFVKSVILDVVQYRAGVLDLVLAAKAELVDKLHVMLRVFAPMDADLSVLEVAHKREVACLDYGRGGIARGAVKFVEMVDDRGTFQNCFVNGFVECSVTWCPPLGGEEGHVESQCEHVAVENGLFVGSEWGVAVAECGVEAFDIACMCLDSADAGRSTPS